ncbi:hypothetical protein [Haladaptatus salinisoli]|uniref:hypothetical protein n=1 Tax=Haladaptatus salinisoli TaxID=2884876 RepID=UPI001D0AE4AA|nr:hypothetical protein [Haladaptatus salinisoli]
MTDELSPNDLAEGMTVKLEWSPKKAAGGGASEGEVTRVWRPDDVREFTVRADDTLWNVYTEYRDPPVERVDEGGEEPETKTIGRLDTIHLLGR